MKDKAALVGLVLGIVFIIMGFGYSNSGVWILGFIFLGIGAWEWNKNAKKTKN